MNRIFLIILCVFICRIAVYGQGFLRTNGQRIINEQGENVLLRGMGLGGWMIQEGYMLQTASFANPQHKIKEKIQELVGQEATEEFYENWLNNHVRKIDIDSLKSWGFNSVRLPMHYNLFTLPIQDEPISGQQTWLDRGFELTDSLISWCKQNEMYVILDLHAAPGGQGYDQGISDYNPNYSSLWESKENRDKTVALWKRLANRYKDESWVAGYDLINETNWEIPGGVLLKNLYKEITDSIRTVDTKHIIFIEGNWFANDFTGLTPPWDDNMVYSPHKYWSTNDQSSIQWVLDLRNQHNIPLYLGESGENSNVWFRDAIALLEEHNIGWAWWPLKKVESISCPLSIDKNINYQRLLDYWEGTGAKPTKENAVLALAELTENIKLENCKLQMDVIDAMFRQVRENLSVPFLDHQLPGIIYATDFDLGTNGVAYSDEDDANYHVSTGNFTAWNTGWSYRNDGVDIEGIQDSDTNNGFNVGWAEEGEWMQYSIGDTESGLYTVKIRYAGGDNGASVRFSLDDGDITPEIIIPYTGGYQSWSDAEIENVVIENTGKLKLHIEGGGANYSYFEFEKTGETIDYSTQLISARTHDENTIQLDLNKSISSDSEYDIEDFRVLINGNLAVINNVSRNEDNHRLLYVDIDTKMRFNHSIKVGYAGEMILANDGSPLETFGLVDVINTLPNYHIIPGKIEAEDFYFQQGIELEDTDDIGGGQNIGYLDIGDYADYRIYIQGGGTYKLDFRTAAESNTGAIKLQIINEFGGITDLITMEFPPTGGWQNWATTTEEVILPSGYYILRMIIEEPLFNINWLKFDFLTSAEETEEDISTEVFPNPVEERLFVRLEESLDKYSELRIYDVLGSLIRIINLDSEKEALFSLNVEDLESGVYLISLISKRGVQETLSFFKN